MRVTMASHCDVDGTKSSITMRQNISLQALDITTFCSSAESMACTEVTSWAEEVGIDATDIEARGVEAIEAVMAGIKRVAAMAGGVGSSGACTSR